MLTFFAGITYSRTTDSIPVYFAAGIDSKTPPFNHPIGFIQGTLLITFSALIGLSAVAYYTKKDSNIQLDEKILVSALTNPKL